MAVPRVGAVIVLVFSKGGDWAGFGVAVPQRAMRGSVAHSALTRVKRPQYCAGQYVGQRAQCLRRRINRGKQVLLHGDKSATYEC